MIKTKTLADVGGDLSRITTYRYPDERMYQYSLDEAMEMGVIGKGSTVLFLGLGSGVTWGANIHRFPD